MSNNIDNQNFASDQYYGMMPPEGAFEDEANRYYLKNRPTVGGWVEGSEGYVQQTFLGASITDFNINAGFNSSPSTLSVSLVVDEYNKSDGIPLGSGDDIYHNGVADCFSPPPIGAPVFFKFGKNHASTLQAYARSFEMIYKYKLIPSDLEVEELKYELTTTRRGMGDVDNLRVVNKDHFLRQSGIYENQRPVFDYNDANPPQPITNNVFVDLSSEYDPLSQQIDPEILKHDSLTAARGRNHFVFGGILQSYSESKSNNGNPLFNVTVVDPKEILSSCTLILNDYAGTTFNNKNLFNIHGFLEHELDEETLDKIIGLYEENPNLVKINTLTKYDILDDSDSKEFNKYLNLEDCYWLKDQVFSSYGDLPLSLQNLSSMQIGKKIRKNILEKTEILDKSDVKYWFPITGKGMSRRTDKGIPLYRVVQALGFMNYFIPSEYKDNGFGGPIDFRGYKFALNIEGLNDLFLDESLLETIYDSAFGEEDEDNPDLHPKQRKLCPAKTVADAMKDVYIESDDLTITDLIQQIAELFNKDFVVELLPPIDDSYLRQYEITTEDDFYSIKEISEYNREIINLIQNEELNENGERYTENDLISAIISVTFIDKNRQPSFNEIAKFVESQNYNDAQLGFDLVNETTDKFLTGAQKVDLYFFSSYKDRDERLQIMLKNPEENEEGGFRGRVDGEIKRLERDKWSFKEALKQQILPYYGELSPGVASIPLGDGPFQQILLNTQSLNVFGVGEYYLATEMELRAAMVSFEQWSSFLTKYSSKYVEGFVPNETTDSLEGASDTEYPPPHDDDLEFIKGQLRALDAYGKIDSSVEEDLHKMKCGVSVPRSVFVSNKNYYASALEPNLEETEAEAEAEAEEKVEIPLPASPCFPPYGYPVYYGRAEAIGILKPADVGKLSNNAEVLQMITNKYLNSQENKGIQNVTPEQLKDFCDDYAKKFAIEKRREFIKSQPKPETPQERETIKEKSNKIYKEYRDTLQRLCSISDSDYAAALYLESNGNFLGFVNSIIRKNKENAKKIHKFLQDIANEHLGKSFLVKMPQKANLRYEKEIKTNGALAGNGMWVESGPFGFPAIAKADKDIPEPNPQDLGELLNPFWDENLVSRADSYIGNKLDDKVIYNSATVFNDSDNSGIFKRSSLTASDTIISNVDLNKEFDYDPSIEATGETIIPYRKDSTKYEGVSYTEGALKPNYNPLSNTWHFNYKPQNMGGWHDIEIKKDGVQENLLYPIDPTKLITDRNRISTYVIYNNSQTLHFKDGDLNSIVQEKVAKVNEAEDAQNQKGMPRVKRMDLCTVLDNVGSEQLQLENPLNSYTEQTVDKFDTDRTSLDEHIAYIKADVDEKFYFAPRFCLYKDLPISADDFRLLRTEPREIDFTTQETEDAEGGVPTGVKLLQVKFINNVFGPFDKQGKDKTKNNVVSLEYSNISRCIKGDINEPKKDEDGNKNPKAAKEEIKKLPAALIPSSKQSMNSAHVYALVKLPCKPVPTVARRFVDGPQQSTNPVTVAKIFNRDTIKGGGPWKQSLKSPPALVQGVEEEKIKYISALNNSNTDRTVIDEVTSFANPEMLIDYVHPSPVIPDTIALPLMSMDRCYGPWRSNANIAGNEARKEGCNETYQNIGGRVEYVKDENLSPWKFDGYENMNKAAEIQVSFSNNLLLFSEKGSFSVSDVVPGVYIGRPLATNTPLVDSVSLSVDGNGIKMSVGMEMFSVKYGKTEKRRQEELSRLTRQEKLRRQNQNKLIRAEADKPQAGSQFQGLLNTVGRTEAPHSSEFSGLQRKETVYDSVVASVIPQKKQVYSYDPLNPQPASGATVIKTSNSASFQYKDYLQEAQSNYTDINELNNSLQRTGGSLLNDMYFPFDEDVYNPFMTNMPYVDIDSITRRTS